MTAADHPAFGEAISNRLAELAALSDESGRLTRLYLSPAHRRAIDLVSYWMRDAGMSVRLDPLASVVGRYEAQDGGTQTLLLGSHIDSVRNAGRFDGPLGVVTAIEVVKAAFKSGKRYPFAIEVVAFGDEEGVRFATTLGGSRALAGTFDEKALDELDESTISRREALTAFGCDPSRVADEKRALDRTLGYVEVHIEQGPVLEKEGLPLGIVTTIDGVSRATIDVEGIAGHAGTVPMAMRHDALAAAAEMLLAIEERARRQPNLVATVGKLEVPRSAPNTIPGRVRFTLDIRGTRGCGTHQSGRGHQGDDRRHRCAPRRDAAIDTRPSGAGGALRRKALRLVGGGSGKLRRRAAADAERRRPRRHGLRQDHSLRHAVYPLPRRREPQPGRICFTRRHRYRRARSRKFFR